MLVLVSWLVLAGMVAVGSGYGPEVWNFELPLFEMSLASAFGDISPTAEQVDWTHLLTAGFLAVALFRPSRAWYAVRYMLTLIHEIGHAFASLVVGGIPSAIRVHADRSGIAHYSAPQEGFWWRKIVVLYAGDVSNAIIVLVGMQALLWIGPVPVWVLLGAITVKAALLSRNLLTFGLAIIIGTLVMFGMMDGVEPWSFGLLVGVFAIIGGATSYDMVIKLSSPREPDSDQGSISEILVFVPAGLVMFSQALATWAMVGYAGYALTVSAF